jgi:hypothetical protein
MIRCIIYMAAIAQAMALCAVAGDGAGIPARPDQGDEVRQAGDIDFLLHESVVVGRSDSNWLEAGAIVPASSNSAEPEKIAVAADALELFQDEAAETPQPDAGSAETPATPDAVFNTGTGSAQNFHRIYECGWTVPYLGPPRAPEPSVGATNTWLPNPCAGAHGNYYQAGDGTWLGNDRYCDVSGAFRDPYDTALRFGWWGVSNDGSLSKIGMYQDLESSPFWDVDMVRSDGRRTLDFWMSGLDEDANAAQANFYAGPGLSARLRYQGYLRNLGHDPLYGKSITDPPLLPADNVVTEDLNVGQDYAIRVQQLDVRFQGRINENLKWRVNVWSQRKFGERQANATAHCFDVDPGPVTNNVCHVLSQRQNIDWRTFQIQPVLEANLDGLSAEYSHTLRAFGQNDQIVDRRYTRFSPFSGPGNTLGPPWMYAFVPDNTINIDRLKLGLNFDEANQVYGNVYYGYSEDNFRDMSRQYSGFDVRYTNRTFDRLTTTAYVNMNADNMSNPPFFLAEETTPANIKHPVDHTWTRAGIKGNWQPIEDLEDRFSIATGYEYYELNREFAVYNTVTPAGNITFHQPDTSSNMIEFSPQMRWSRSLFSFVRYKAWFVNDPLIGVREANGRLNSNLPTQEHRVEIGGWWSPTTNFMTTAQFGIADRWHKSGYADFSENSYPFSWTMWYAPTQKLSISGGYGYYSNWIDQDITLGYRFNAFPDQTETTRWNYAGENHVANVNVAYAWTPTVQLVAGYEYNWGNNVFTPAPSPAGADWSQLASFSDVLVEQNRVTAGADWQPYENTTLYLRYIYFDFNDLGANVQSGTTHMALAGAGVVF